MRNSNCETSEEFDSNYANCDLNLLKIKLIVLSACSGYFSSTYGRGYLSGGSSLPTVHTGDRLHSERSRSRGEERPGQYLQSGCPADFQTLS